MFAYCQQVSSLCLIHLFLKKKKNVYNQSYLEALENLPFEGFME